MANNVLNAVSGQSSNITNTVYNSISAAGTDAGNSVANSIQNALSVKQFFVNVTGWVKTLFGINKNASAMATGKIYNTPSIFGYANGAFQVAGDAGPEAVVGVNSLFRMIQSAVRGAVDGTFTVPRANPAPRNIVVPLYIDGREFARAEVPYIESEQQRKGTKLVTGVKL